jgi:hypothetical protein
MRSLLRICVVAVVVASLSVGMLALAKKPPKPGGDGCPPPSCGWFCYDLYAPVVCGPDDCQYSNDCYASCAGWKSNQCTPVGPGPVPL